jgi:hypothetical protein
MNKTGRILHGVLCALAFFALFSSCEQPDAPGSIFAPPPDLRPAAPDAPRVIAGDGLITVSWNPVSNAGEYEVYLSGGTMLPDTPSRTVSSSPQVFSGLSNKTPQYVWLKAKNAHGSSGFSPYAYGTPWPSGEVPETPGQPTVSAGVGRLTLTWGAAGGAESYQVYIGTTDTRPPSPVMTVNGTTATINDLTNNVIYYLWIRAVNGNGPSDGYSPIQVGTPAIPAAAPAAPSKPLIAAGNRKLSVTWQAVEMAAAYEVWKGTSANSDTATLCGTISDGTTRMVLESLENGTNYYVWVKAKNSVGSSGFSPYASAAPSAFTESPAAPGRPTVTSGSGQLTVSWPAVEGASGYEVWKGETDNITTAAQYGEDTGATFITVTGLTNGTTYYFWIKAKNSVGTSGASPAGNGTPSVSDGPPAAPGTPAVTAASNQLTVSWNAVPGATAYEVWTAPSANTTAALKHGNDLTGLSLVITGLNNGDPCYVWLKAKNSTGTSGFSPAASGIPAAVSVSGQTPAVPGVSLGNEQLTVTWAAVTGASWYQVWLSPTIDTIESAEQYGENITGSLSKTITGLTNGTTYYIWIRAGNGSDTSNFSGRASGIPITDASAPAVALGSGQLILDWAAMTGASEYEVFYSAGTTPPQTSAQTVSTPSAVITGLSNGVTYHVWVRGKNSTGTGAISPGASGKPIGGMGEITLSSGDGQVTASWAAVAGAEQYEVYCHTSAAMPGSPVQTVSATSGTITGLTNGTTYYLWVKPINSSGAGAVSTAVSGKPLEMPGTPTLTARDGQLTVTWTAVTGADEYEVYCDTSPSPVTFKQTTSGVSTTITGLTNETLYYVRLKAKGGSSVTGYGPAASGKPTISGLYKGSAFATAVKIGIMDLAASLTYISSKAVTGDNYYIVLGANESIAPTGISYGGKTIGITLMGTGGERLITLKKAGSLFIINAGVTLTLDDKITLVGRTDNSTSLVKVNSGASLVMNTGSKITGNKASSFSGGGVYVESGTFTMEGGEISGNTVSSSSSYGGGVYVASNGTFTMGGGEISGNTASSSYSSYGGGVSVSGGTFTMEGGEISGNTASYSSYSSSGGGVYVGSGTFTKTPTGGVVYGSNATPVSLQNSADGHGDAVYRYDGSKERNSTIAANEAFHSNQNTGWD